MKKNRLVPTVCPYCGVGCRFFISLVDGRAAGIEYMTHHPVAHGRLCSKGNLALEVLDHPDRLRHPLKKTTGGWEAISWDQALDVAAGKLKAACRSDPSGALGFLASAKCTNEENYLFQKFARLMGCNHVDHCARLCHAPTVTALGRSFGSGAMTGPLSDLAESDCIFIIGSNPAENHAPVLEWIWQAKDRGASVIVADPRLTPTARLADQFLQIKPGSDGALLNGMARVIVTEGLLDRKFIGQRTRGFAAFQASVADALPGKTAAVTGLSEGQILRATRTYASARNAALVYCMGITQHTAGSDNVTACANLALATGNIGKPGAGLFPLRGQNNVQGACDMGALPNVFPGYQPVSDPAVRTRFSQLWNTGDLPSEPGLTAVEMMNAAADGRIRVMWIMGEDPVNSDPNTTRVRGALSSLDFLIVQDIFLTDTAQMADLVLPADAWAEKSGTFTSTERRIQWVERAVSPPGDARADLWIINEAGKRLGLDLAGDRSEDVLEEINRAVPFYGGATRDRTASPEGVQWPCPHSGHPGTPRLHETRFSTPDGKARFFPTRYRPPAECTSPAFPLVLTTGRTALHYNSGSMTLRTPDLVKKAGTAYLEIHPLDADHHKIKRNDPVTVRTLRGETTVRARITDTIEPGVVFLPFHFPGVNLLTIDALDHDAKIPEFKTAACRIEKGSET